jgi:hypothetical protein
MRRTNVTRLLVCEGYAEVEFARVVRDLYLPRGCGVALKIENRRGSGGAAALALAIERSGHGAYDGYGVLIDTDQQWTGTERDAARAHGIVAVECTPCLEAMLLDVESHRTYARTADNKTAFKRAYGDEAHRHGVIQRHFDRAKLDGARARVAPIDALLRFLNC